MFIAALFTIANIWKKPKSPSPDEWIAQICVYIYTYTGASLVAQSVKKLTAMWETQVQSLGQGDTLEVETATQFGILAGGFHGQRSLAGPRDYRVRHN